MPSRAPAGAFMATFKQLIASASAELKQADIFYGHGYESAHDEAVALVLAAAELPIDADQSLLNEEVSADIQGLTDTLLRQRIVERRPTAYIIGKAWLGPLEFICDNRALVPRSPLMEVIAADYQPWLSGSPFHLVDLCCGGGSLGILAAKNRPDLGVTLVDIDSQALSLARENVALHEVPKVRLIKGDLLSSLAPSSVDVILANPPYVDAEDMQSLPREFMHEPSLALAAGDDGLDLVHRLLIQASSCLSENGFLFLEVGNSWLALERAYPDVSFDWLELEWGGHGVCAIGKQELQYLRSCAECA
jgi:ribosomal protein L3 glutamine methyltransferase